ncbi:MAG: dehydrogenase, partial [Candidatus Methanomethylophilus sp.]|nr:dehydrogenase [Methanomethylophilus sp.]
MEFVLPALILVPLIGAIITLFMGGSRQKYACTVALVFTVATLLLSLILMITNVNDLSKFDVNYGWINAAGLKMSIIL